jgi:Pro-kumamolisin, activation domain
VDGRRAEIAGSDPKHAGEQTETALEGGHPLTATIVLRHKPQSADLEQRLFAGDPVGHGDASADPEDVAAVKAFARQFGLQIVSADAAKRSVKVAGTAAAFQRAFDIKLGRFGDYVSYRGPLTVPESLAPVILAVLGLDTRPVASPR